MTSLSKKGPVYKQKSHGIEVAVWKREHDGKAFYSVSATRSYRDSDGNWKTSNSFNLEDRDILMDYLDRAFKDAQARLDADRAKRAEEDQAA
jgi:hypothetical protein